MGILVVQIVRFFLYLEVFVPTVAYQRHCPQRKIPTGQSHNRSSSFMTKDTWNHESIQDNNTVERKLNIWPLDENNAKLLNEVHPKEWDMSEFAHDSAVVYDLVAIGAGAGGLVSSRQAARRGAKSAMISAHLAGGDCLNVGCVPSKALIRCARMIREVKLAKENSEFGVKISGEVEVDFETIMERMRKLRAEIAPIDGHTRGKDIGVNVFQGFGRFIDHETVEVKPMQHDANPDQNNKEPIRLKFKKAAICTGGRAKIPSDIPGLNSSPFVTNETLFNLTKLPKRMVILGSGVVALEMAQTFATFGSEVIVLVRSNTLFPRGDSDAGPLIQKCLEESGNVKFLMNARLENVETLHKPTNQSELPLMQLKVEVGNGIENIDFVDCLLVAAGRIPNVEGMNLEAANIAYDVEKGILVDDNARSISNPNVYSVGDCTSGVPRLTHMSGEMAKVCVQNALFEDDWKLSSLVVPSTMYTEPEFASVGVTMEDTNTEVFKASLEHNDRAILDSDREGYVKIFCDKNTGKIMGCSIIASRAGEMINEVTLAMKYGLTLEQIGRNIHCYPTISESVMSCGIQRINSKWKVLN
jgi:pyruvate/2-oxoglutarate dehydrogenase complex dihydrolipoamide dehydrogenase (E3) component